MNHLLTTSTTHGGRFLASQARDPAPHYQHSMLGYNYRLSNVLAAIGRAQLHLLTDRVAARRAIFEFYRRAIGDLPGVAFIKDRGGRYIFYNEAPAGNQAPREHPFLGKTGKPRKGR